MRISKLNDGRTYVGTGDFFTVEEWTEYLDWKFNHTPGKAYTELIPKQRAKALGATCAKASCFECGPGYLFENDSVESLEKRARELFPQLF